MSWGDRSLLPRKDPLAAERRWASVLFFSTCCSVFGVTAWRWSGGAPLSDPAALSDALRFTAVLMGILLAHELGHYVVAARHGFHLSLPWFLPAPFLIGTLGAIIRLHETPRTRTALLEMGAAGPLSGLVVIIGAWLWWFVGGSAAPLEGPELSAPPLVHALSWITTGGGPAPISARDPVAFGAWLGCLLTAMNLLPFGQLDGGHVSGAAWPSASAWLGWAVTAALLLGAAFWPGWGAWVAVLHLLGTRHPVQVKRPDKPLTGRSKAIGGLCIVAFLLCFTPVPVG